MQKQHKRARAVCVAMVVTALGALGFAGSASAFSEPFQKFQNCPYTNAEVVKCIYALTEGGEVVLGSKTVPIVNPVALQGGYGAANEETKFSKFFGATNGVTLEKVPQPVPGGLAGIINCKEIGEPFLRFSCELFFENGVTGLNSTLELARPASEIKISESNMSRKEGVALQLPIKIHLENPFLGSNCYVGSSSSPIIWNLTSGVTAPPPPNEPIEGSAGKVKFVEGGRILQLNENKLVDNAWSAPGVSGCGGFLVELILNPIINGASGLPAKAGRNTAILKNTVSLATAAAVKKTTKNSRRPNQARRFTSAGGDPRRSLHVRPPRVPARGCKSLCGSDDRNHKPKATASSRGEVGRKPKANPGARGTRTVGCPYPGRPVGMSVSTHVSRSPRGGQSPGRS